jgi:hypothetical protein
MGTAARRLSVRSHFGPDKHADALPTLYLALFQGDPFGAGVEPTSTGGYARKAIANDGTLWGTVAVGQMQVASLIDVAFVAASGLWSITTALNYWAVFDNSSGGALWYGGPLSPTITITGAGDQARLPAGTWLIAQGS